MQPSICFFKENVKFRFLKSTQIRNWIKRVIRIEGKVTGEINVIFCSDSYLLDLNRKFLNHNYFTDIITFNNSIEKFIGGEIYISIDRVKENAVNLEISFQIELSRVIIHGVLHLLGYSDTTNTQKNVMRLKEDACLSLLPSFT